MSLVPSNLLPALEQKLPKVIDARTHGIIDYCHAAFFLTLGCALLKSNKRAAAASFTTGSFILAQSMLTDYPLGLKPVFSFEQHGRMDAAFASISWVVPRIFGFARTGPAHIFEANSITEAVVVGLTNFSSAHARLEEEL